MTTELVVPPEFAEFVPDHLPSSTEAIEVWVARAREQAEAIEIKTEEDAQKAVDLTKRFKSEIERFEQERRALTKPRKDAAEFIKKQFDNAQAPFLEHNDVLKQKISAWLVEKNRRAEEQQRKIEEERARVEAEARVKREAAEKAEREAAELREQAASEADAEVAAELAEEARRDAERAAVTETAIQTLPPPKPASAPALAGFSRPKRWQIKAITRDALPPEYLIPDERAIKEAMRLGVKENGQPPVIPGVEFERVSGSAVRT